MDHEQSHAERLRIEQDIKDQTRKRWLDVATAALLLIGGGALAHETHSQLWIVFGGVMALAGVVRLSQL